MSTEGSVTRHILALPRREQSTFQELWDRYFRRLVELARQHLRGRLTEDAEDVAASAFDSFFRRAQAGQFLKLQNRCDLWEVLALLTRRKAANLANFWHRANRDRRREIEASALLAGLDGDEGQAFIDLVSREPDPSAAVEMAEEVGRLLDLLANDQLRSIAVWKMEGYTNKEIAGRLGRSVNTVELKLQIIRGTWMEAMS